MRIGVYLRQDEIPVAFVGLATEEAIEVAWVPVAVRLGHKLTPTLSFFSPQDAPGWRLFVAELRQLADHLGAGERESLIAAADLVERGLATGVEIVVC